MKKVRIVFSWLAILFGLETLALIACATGVSKFFGLIGRGFGFIGTLFTNVGASPAKIAIIVISIVVALAVIFGIYWQWKKKKPVLAPIAAALGYVLIIALIWKGDSVKAFLSNPRGNYNISGAHAYFLFICLIATIVCLLVYSTLGFLAKAGEGRICFCWAQGKKEEPKEIVVVKEDYSKYRANDDVVLGASVGFSNTQHSLKATITELDGEVLKVEEGSYRFTRKMIIDYVLDMSGEDHPVETVLSPAKSDRSPDSLNLKTCNMTLIYGKDFNLTLLLRLPSSVAEDAKANHTVEDSNFAGTKDYYKVLLATSWKSFDEVKALLEASYSYVLDKYFKFEDGQYVALEEEISEELIEEAVNEDPNKYEAKSEVAVGNTVAFVNDKHTVIAEILEVDGVGAVEEPAEEDSDEESPEGSGFPDIKSRTFVEKFKGADKELRAKYSEIKNALLSHKKVHSRISKSGDSFRYGRDLLASITIVGKHIRVYFALNPNDYENSKFHHFDASDKKKYEETPLLMKVKSDLSVKNTIKLIDDICAKYEAAVDPKYEAVDYSKKNSLDK